MKVASIEGRVERAPLYCPPFRPMADLITPGERGNAKLDVVTVSEDDARLHNMRCAFQPGGSAATVEPGRYARLTHKGRFDVTMTDAPFERRTTLGGYRWARGRVLILGLGVGMLPVALQHNDDVSSIAIVEIDPNVIELVRPTIREHAPKASIYQGDAFLPERTGLPTTRDGGGFDMIFADIWPTICADDYVEHVALRQAWRRWRRRGSEHITWVEDQVKRLWRDIAPPPSRALQPDRPDARDLATDLLRAKRAAAATP